MARKFKQLVEKQDEIELQSLIGRGGYGDAYDAHIIRNGKLLRRVVVKLLHLKTHPTRYQTDEFANELLDGHRKWFEKIPELQRKYPRLIFNNQQVIPISKISVRPGLLLPLYYLGSHVIVSEAYKNNPRAPPSEMSLSVGGVCSKKDIEQAADFVLDELKEGIVIPHDVLTTVQSNKRSRIVVRDSDVPAKHFTPTGYYKWNTTRSIHHAIAAVTLNFLHNMRAITALDANIPQKIGEKTDPVHHSKMFDLLFSHAPVTALNKFIDEHS